MLNTPIKIIAADKLENVCTVSKGSQITVIIHSCFIQKDEIFTICYLKKDDINLKRVFDNEHSIVLIMFHSLQCINLTILNYIDNNNILLTNKINKIHK